jgi:NADPH:quinone reductase-like Zn-dependent oxidoreductase
MADPQPGPGEVRIRIAASGIDPGDLKKRQGAFGGRASTSSAASRSRRSPRARARETKRRPGRVVMTVAAF